MRVASINWYRNNSQPHADTKRIRNLGCDVIGFQEIWDDLELVDRELPNHKLLHARRTDSRASREVAVGLRNNNRLIGYNAREVSDVEKGEETSIFKSRWITVVRFIHPEGNGKYTRVALINYHGNAVTQGPNTGQLLRSERVREWLEAAREIERTIKALQKSGYKILVTGDWNYRRFSVKGFVLAYWSPQMIFRRTGLRWVENRLDYVAWSKSFRKRARMFIPQSVTGADHDWIIVDLD